jgi:hypothetical protein
MEVFGFGGIADTEYSVSVETNYSAEYLAETGIRSTTSRNWSPNYSVLLKILASSRLSLLAKIQRFQSIISRLYLSNSQILHHLMRFTKLSK